MFKNRKLIILSALLMLVVLIGCASAADVNDIQQVTQDSAGEIITDEVSSAGIDDNSGLEELENENVLSNSLNESSENDNVLTANIPVTGNTFQDIQGAIDSASDGDTIQLNSITYLGSGKQINVTKNQLTIIGSDGCTLDAQGLSRIFNVTGNNVIIQNIKFINGNATGGAIYWTGANGAITDSTFTNNIAKPNDLYGGAAIFWSGENCTITDSTFANNNASFTTQIMYGNGIIHLRNSPNAKISGCTFVDNSAGRGGAIYVNNSAEFTISSCDFRNNNANWAGGAIYADNNHNGNIHDCNFTNNTAFHPSPNAGNGYGGAINGYNCTIYNCNFTNNSVKSEGGAIGGNNNTIYNCNFTNNTARFGGGAISCTNMSVSDCNFDNNSAESWGGAIRMHGKDNIIDCNFTNNSVGVAGGAIDGWCHNSTISGCNFINNIAPPREGGSAAGAIQLEGSNNTISHCNFTNNYADVGGAIEFYDSLNSKVSECNFTNNTAKYEGGAFYCRVSGGLSQGVNITITKCNFENNSANTWGGGAIGWNCENGTVSECNFTNNNATDGGAIRWDRNNGVITDCIFTNNNASSEGGAIYIHSSAKNNSISNCNFTNNNATNGGAIYHYATEKSEVTNSNFINNTAEKGGAINIYYKCNNSYVSNCNFTNNTADIGGAINIYMSNNTALSNCNFTNNTAVSGSALHLEESNSDISDSYFIDNQAHSKDLIGTRDNSVVEFTFTGNDNYINAIYSKDDHVVNKITFDNVTFWNGSIVNTDDTGNPDKSSQEAGINITLEIYNADGQLIKNITKMTDAEGHIYYEIGDEDIICKAYHLEDTYYTYIETELYVGPIPELTINKTVNASEVEKGSLVNFTIEITNIGKTIATQINISDRIPYGLNFVDASEGWFTDNGYITWNINRLAAGESTSVWIVVYATNYGQYTNTARAICESMEDYITDSANVNVKTPITINKTVNESVVENGSSVNFTIEITNNGAIDMTNVCIVDIIPGGLVFDNATEGWSLYYNVPNYIQWTIPKLLAGESRSVWIVVNTTDYGTFENIAYVFPRDMSFQAFDTENVTVTKAPSSVSADNVTKVYGEEITVTVTSKNATSVTYKITGDGVEINGTVSEDGTITVPKLDVGEYTVTLTTVTDDNHEPATSTAKITVQKMGTIVTVDKIVNYTGAVVEVIANVTDANGNPINGGTATFTIHYDNPIGIGLLMANAKEYTTDVIDGKATFKDVTLGAPGKYQSTIEYSGNGNYESASDKSEVEILALNTTVESDDVSGSSGEKTDIVAEIVDQNSKPVQNGTAVLKVNGKEYTAEVKDGKATFKDVELPSEDTEATIEYLGNDYYNPSNTTVQITINEEPQPEPDDGNETEPDTPDSNPEEPGESEGSQTAAMEKTGNPIFLLIVAVLACLPILRRKQ